MVKSAQTWAGGLRQRGRGALRPETDVAFYGKLCDFGYGEPDCRVFNYWDEGYPVKGQGVNACPNALLRGPRMLIVATAYGSGGDVRVALDRKKVGLPVNITAKDFETGESIPRNSSGESVF